MSTSCPNNCLEPPTHRKDVTPDDILRNGLPFLDQHSFQLSKSHWLHSPQAHSSTKLPTNALLGSDQDSATAMVGHWFAAGVESQWRVLQHAVSRYLAETTANHVVPRKEPLVTSRWYLGIPLHLDGRIQRGVASYGERWPSPRRLCSKTQHWANLSPHVGRFACYRRWRTG